MESDTDFVIRQTNHEAQPENIVDRAVGKITLNDTSN